MIFDVFTLVFRSNAKEVIQGNKEAAKSTRELEKDLKNTGDEAEKTAKRYKEITDSATKAAAAVISFGAIKSGILNTAKFNSELEVTGKIINQNAGEMLAFGAAVEAAGGTVQGLQQTVKSAFSAAASAGLPLPPIDKYFENIRKRIAGLSKNEQYRILNDQLGINDPGLINLLTMSEAEYRKAMQAARDYAKVTEESLKASREFQQELSATGQSLQAFWGNVNQYVLPVFTVGLQAMRSFFDIINENKGAALGFFAALTSVTGLLALKSVQTAAGIIGIGAAVGKILGPLALLLTRLTAIGAVVATAFVLPEASKRGGRSLAHWINRQLGRGDANGVLPGREGYIGPQVNKGPMMNANSDAHSYFKSQGYTDEEIAAIMANIQRESSNDPTKRGDNGQAHGLAQWHAPRRAAILKATGIDVSTANYAQQLQAIAWEMKNEPGFNDQYFRALNGAGAKAAYFSKAFERPANGDFEAAKRAQMAMGYMQQIGPASMGMAGNTSNRETNIKIDKIEVNTQATDAAGIASGIDAELQRSLNYATCNMDDGVMM